MSTQLELLQTIIDKMDLAGISQAEVNEILTNWRGGCATMQGRERERYTLVCKQETKTQQQFRDEADVNIIMKTWRRTGVLPPNTGKGRYGDFDTTLDYQQALTAVQEAQDDFDALGADLRHMLHNDPAELLDFIRDPDNHDQAVALGLINPPADLETPAQPPAETPEEPPLSEPALPANEGE